MNIEEKYQKLEDVQHVLLRPEMYIGSVQEQDNNVWVLEDNKIIEKTTKYHAGLFKIFDEILVNAYDESIRDQTLTTIEVSINPNTNEISVYNNGKGIDVVIHKKYNIYVPELIFGHLRSSTSYSDVSAKVYGGTYGYGAKLTAIFSSFFKVEIGDPVHKKEFSQYYKNNLSFKSKPIIKNYNKSTGYVKITFVPDLKYFKLDKLSDDLVNMMKRRVYDIAALTGKKIKVYLDNKLVPINSFDQYVSLFTDSEQIKNACDTSESEKSERWQIIVTKSDGKFKQMSFVNSVNTILGGRHVDYIVNQITKQLKDYIEKKYKTTKIRSQLLKDQIWIFISSSIESPAFSSQSKEELVTPSTKFGSSCLINPSFVMKIFNKFDLGTLISHQIKYMEGIELTKTEKKPKRTLNGIPKLNDANYAGTAKSHLCTLILTEGDSAKSTILSGVSAIKDTNSYYGVFPLRGKLLNVREATHQQILHNEEFKNLKLILGLHTGKVYTKDNLNELRYGSIIIASDADVDGAHIKGLVINMIHYYWPSLLKIDGFIKIFITPIVKVSQKDTIISFYSLEDYNKWKKSVNPNKWSIKYYKGLGTSTAEEAKEYFRNLDKHVKNLKWVESTDTTIQLAFAKEKADDRKEWLKHYDSSEILDYTKQTITYKDFINLDLIHFSNSDNVRSIPSVMDGLKPSQRKILFAAFKKNLTQDIKVAQFASYTAEVSDYLHGEVSLVNTIIGMAQNFVGSNNINLLYPSGQFGTRLLSGKDAASARYIYTRLETITRLIFHKDDDPFLNYLSEDEMEIEPEYYMPIIPMILVNGTTGIGTGWSTYIPCFNPLDIIDNLEKKIKNEKLKELTPYYKNYKGNIIKKDKFTYLTTAKYEKTDNELKITELPITSWTENYKVFLEQLVEDGIIKKFINNSTDTLIDFTIKFPNDVNVKKMQDKEIEKMFGLTRVINLSNMHLHDKDNHIKKYDSANKIINEFYDVRIQFYDKRKKYLLEKLGKEIDILESKIKFINLNIKKEIELFNKSKDDIIKILRSKKLLELKDETQPFDYLISMSFYSMTKEKIEELKKQMADKKKVFDELQKKKIEDIWLDDLGALKNELKKFDK